MMRIILARAMPLLSTLFLVGMFAGAVALTAKAHAPKADAPAAAAAAAPKR